MQNVTAIFDIGKTNKKFFLFDANFQEVYREYTSFDTIEDEDGHPTENLPALQKWLKNVFDSILNEGKFNVIAINFSTYGASLVHLDENGEVLTPLYNYTKPLENEIIESFFEKYSPEDEFAAITGSTNSGMLNSGMQLYWLKTKKPDLFKKIRYSLHLPQYISYVFTGIPLSEYTSIGCHTALWDYSKKDYHSWVYAEGLHKIFPPIVSTETSINMNYNGKRIKIGVGIHDSSAALLPYVRSIEKKFVLVSTGTWSITLNPFENGVLSKTEVKQDCINYMRINGKPVKSTRLFLGNEYSHQIKILSEHYQVSEDYHTSVAFDMELYLKLKKDFQHRFSWKALNSPEMPTRTVLNYDTFEEAYHQLMMELVELQVKSIKMAQGAMSIKRLYIDGGFSDNEIYIQLLSDALKDMKLRTTDSSLGSALGAAIAISDVKLNSKFLKNNYSLKKHVPFITK
ncbi:FGGY family carbohydrate kinase [Maribacter litopenaei]|uniref:FGGY family carbohydrate kinase n=1 Tax=Maribacter litopenaei TaxID=2976127 RepID=A0ABY5YBE0_9FLAO|nr:FGGY family carbohydrate kinase [Maribacter litopenaei]UWX55529.1 FGGY family carbohydrate kinase [Maribacter litopenaei]